MIIKLKKLYGKMSNLYGKYLTKLLLKKDIHMKVNKLFFWIKMKLKIMGILQKNSVK